MFYFRKSSFRIWDLWLMSVDENSSSCFDWFWPGSVLRIVLYFDDPITLQCWIGSDDQLRGRVRVYRHRYTSGYACAIVTSVKRFQEPGL